MPVFKKYIPQSPSRRQTLRFNLCLKFNQLFHVQGKQYEKTALYSLNAILVEDVHKKGHRSSPLPPQPSQTKPKTIGMHGRWSERMALNHPTNTPANS